MNPYRMIIRNGLSEAPAMVVFSDTPENAEKEARKLSGLGRFESWQFIASQITNYKKVNYGKEEQ